MCTEIIFVSLSGLDLDLMRLRFPKLPDLMPEELSSCNLAGDFVLHRLLGIGDRNFSQNSVVLSILSLFVADLDRCLAAGVGMLKCPITVRPATSKAEFADLLECFVSVSTYMTALIWRDTLSAWEEETGDLPCLAREVTTTLSFLRSAWQPIKRWGVEGARDWREGTQWVMTDLRVDGSLML